MAKEVGSSIPISSNITGSLQCREPFLILSIFPAAGLQRVLQISVSMQSVLVGYQPPLCSLNIAAKPNRTLYTVSCSPDSLLIFLFLCLVARNHIVLDGCIIHTACRYSHGNPVRAILWTSTHIRTRDTEGLSWVRE